MGIQGPNEGSSAGYYATQGMIGEASWGDVQANYIAGAIVQPNTAGMMTKARETLRGMILGSWVPFTSAIVSRFLAPRPPLAPWQSPQDLDAGEHITRYGPFPVDQRDFPYPYMIGAVSGFLSMQDQWSMQWAYARNAYGPGVLTPVPVPWDTTYPGLAKVQG